MTPSKKRLPPKDYIEGILRGDRVVLSRAITIIESTRKEDEALADEILGSILPYTGKSIRVGLTGAPGVGKSTFIEAFGKIISQKHQLAVLTIDPSSARTKGSILGDKTRMNELSRNPTVYIRPSPAGDKLGGISAKTRETMLLCEAAGFDLIIIETVGVGQSETLVKGMTDFFLLLMQPGGGDELQGIKKGIMEMADMVVVTKADGESLMLAEKTRRDFENALALLHTYNNAYKIRALVCSSVTNYNMSQIWNEIESFIHQMKELGKFYQNRNEQNLEWMENFIQWKLESAFYDNPSVNQSLTTLRKAVVAGTIDPLKATKDLLSLFFNHQNR